MLRFPQLPNALSAKKHQITNWHCCCQVERLVSVLLKDVNMNQLAQSISKISFFLSYGFLGAIRSLHPNTGAVSQAFDLKRSTMQTTVWSTRFRHRLHL